MDKSGECNYTFWDLRYYEKDNLKGKWDETYYIVPVAQNKCRDVNTLQEDEDDDVKWEFVNGRYMLVEKTDIVKNKPSLCKNIGADIIYPSCYDVFMSLLSNAEWNIIKNNKFTIDMFFNVNETFMFEKTINKLVTPNSDKYDNDQERAMNYINARLEKFVSLSKSQNKIIPMFHGTTDKFMQNIRITGFLNKEKRRVDAGWYGKGVYFTSNLNLAMSYGKHVLVSLVAPGNIYPLEKNEITNLTLLGKDVKQGYDSHYVANGKGHLSGPNHYYDELVIFDTTRILPLFNIIFS